MSDPPLDLDRAIDFTVDWADSFAHHGTMLTHTETSVYPPRGVGTRRRELWDSFRVHLCPHSVTHMDLPWALDGVEPAYGTREAQELRMERYTCTQAFDAVVLDLRAKQDVLAAALGEPLLEETRPLEPLPVDRLHELICDLLITPGDIESALEGADEAGQERGILEGRFVVFHTGWRERFATGWHDLGNPGWELFHPYLVHPFLDAGTAQWLIKAQVAGVGIDGSNLECPLYYADPLIVPRYEELQRNYWRRTVHGDELAEPAHSRLLNAHLLLVESLGIEGKALDEHYGGRRFALGRLWSFPLHIRNLRDACITRILFEPGAPHGPA
ncbi:MAG: cyclase family protein [Candidatus Brocadiia bacterium]